MRDEFNISILNINIYISQRNMNISNNMRLIVIIVILIVIVHIYILFEIIGLDTSLILHSHSQTHVLTLMTASHQLD
jgi:hypothetical protein